MDAAGRIVILTRRFRGPRLRLRPRAHRDFLSELPERGVVGGAVYDALVAATASHAGAELVTCDRRAQPIYERFGVRLVLV